MQTISKQKANSSFSIASTTSISILPSHNLNSHRLNSADFLRLLIDEHNSSRESKFSSTLHPQSAIDMDTIQEYEFMHENIATLRLESSIFCTNCLESIEVELIDSHSLTCLEPESNFDKIVEKIKTYLNWVRNMKVECKDCYLLPLILLEDIAKKVLDDRNEIFHSFDKIKSIIRDFNDFPFILLATQRLSLILETLVCENPGCVLEPVQKINIEVIESSVQISKVLDSFISGLSDISVENLNGRPSPAEPSEALEKYFYSQCIKNKLKKSSNKGLSMFNLYQNCLENGKPVKEWKNFIYEAYNSK